MRGPRTGSLPLAAGILSLTWGALSCAPEATTADDNTSDESAALSSTNGLTMINGLTMTNGLTMINGLPNGPVLGQMVGSTLTLFPLSGGAFSPAGALMNSASGRSTASYLVRCALPPGHTVTLKDARGTAYSFGGALGLAPRWETASCDAGCQEYVSACLMAHINTAGLHLSLWLDAANPGIGWGQNATYSQQEGSFFGNIFVSPPRAYYCEGAGFTGGISGVAAGRINAAGSDPLYVNPFGSGVPCSNTAGMVGYTSSGAAIPDGFVQLNYQRNWSNIVTVWRTPTYQAAFDKSYRYMFLALSTRAAPMSINLSNGSTAAGTVINQWPRSANLASSQFSVLQSGSYWNVVPILDTGKCMTGGGADGAKVTLQACNGAANQQWAFKTDGGYGTAFMQNQSNGLCLQSNDKLQGTAMVVSDCALHSWREFQITATQ